MKKLYEKSELTLSLIWIGVYVVLLSLADGLSDTLGMAKVITAPLCALLAGFLYVWIRKNGLVEKYGLCRFQGKAKTYLYFIPLALLVLPNVWWGVVLNFSVPETVLCIISMLGVGFLEEIIFRGFLFKALSKDNIKTAVIISSLTFGIGHIVNLLNGSPVPETLIQICYAVSAGFLFTILFLRCKSLWPCIIAHGAVNSLSAFANEGAMTLPRHFISGAFLCVVPLVYGVYILKRTEKQDAVG